MSPIVLLLLLSFCVLFVEGKTCYSMDIRNTVDSLNQLKNCTEIAGFLKIVLMETVKNESDFDGYVFPELVEITGYLLFYNVLHLSSVGQLFPNLRVIRGTELLTDYAMVIYDMPHIREIGTDKLMFIARGFVKVDKCPHICFANTVDWEGLGAGGLHFTNLNNGTCDACPNHCKGHCWNATQCQIPTSTCDRECLGCTKMNSPRHCSVCKNLEDNGTCVEKCPPNKYVHAYVNKCVTKEECTTLMQSKGPWWTHEDTCVSECPQFFEQDTRVTSDGVNETFCKFCGENCEKHCSTTDIESIYKLQALKGCTHIDSNLVIKVKNVDPSVRLSSALEENLGSVKYIYGYLVVGRMNAMRSLSFLNNLTYIGGVDKNVSRDVSYAIFVYENQNLQHLWRFDDGFNLTIGRGTLRFHNNPQLCPVEIAALANATNTYFSPLDVSPYSNGNRADCATEKMTFNVTESSKNATLSWDQLPLPVNDTYIGYTVYYKEQFYGDASASDSDNVCAESVETQWRSSFTRNNSIFLDNLEPYTRYAYYIKIYRSSKVTTQSTIMYLWTLPDDPEAPEDVTVTALDHATIRLDWSPPGRTNGVLAHYKVDFNALPDAPVDRNYCTERTTLDGYKIDEDSEDMEIEPKLGNKTVIIDIPYESNCSCPLPKFPPNKNTISEFKDITIHSFDRRYELCEDLAQSKFQRDDCKQFIYKVISHDNSDIIVINKRNDGQQNGFVNTSNQYYIFPNLTSFNITNLNHSTMYIFYFSACNEPTENRRCSPILQLFARTKKEEEADDIKYVHIENIDTTSVKITWTEPTNPNSVIVSYRFEIMKDDVKHLGSTTIDCLPRNSSFKGPEYLLPNLTPGSYSVRIRAESLAGLGKFSRKYSFSISAPAKDVVIIVPVLVVSFLLIIAAIGFYWLYKRKQILENIRLFPSINPDYEGVVYEEDEWEIDRNDLELGEDLGRGTFGTVNYGVIKSRNLPCAVKTINATLSMPDRMEFLNEASVMKSFSNCHHVVKLLGVVSKGQPPLVVMELMDRGDLKRFLRRTRDSSRDLTSNEIYRMAAEIADGMAYLAARKFVHRDLAARNCMVAGDRTVKVGDFGMTRDIYETDYYRKESKGLLPVRWMAPESLADGVFSSDSDVWSYGIVLWEIATLAEQPYQGLSNEEVLKFVTSKGRLNRPPECSDLLYELMRQCWSWLPNDRPVFWDIVERLERHVSHDFEVVSFIHSREGHEYRIVHGRQRAYNPPALSSEPVEDAFGRYDVSEDEVSLHVGTVPRRPSYLQQTMNRKGSGLSPSDFY
ncbi:unnamed protein product [Phaedon cochleariae]|uniref:Tyrosine-protein kinase receptor n=1 Tax=Phaedon cochleariae TaxID=80249 RepID=A0A9P0DPI2_PHACE|nr:unnamed protein product [Phaedon cochleariae]